MIDPTLTFTFTDGLIIGAVVATGIVCEYRRWAQRLAEKRQRRADRTTPRVVGQDFFMDSIDWKGFPNG